jgi:hypothetical protein
MESFVWKDKYELTSKGDLERIAREWTKMRFGKVAIWIKINPCGSLIAIHGEDGILRLINAQISINTRSGFTH